MRAAVAARSQEEETIVKVLLINGSPRWKGNTNRALEEAAAALEAEGVQTELVWIGNKEIRGCIACGICGKTGDKHCVFAEDCCNELIAKAAECDGFIVGSPVYYAGMAGSLRALMDRMFYAGGTNFRMKPAAGRRCGAPGRGHRGGRPDQQVLPDQLPAHCVQLLLGHCLRAQPRRGAGDGEGLHTMRVLGRNMAWMLKCIEAGHAAGINRRA